MSDDNVKLLCSFGGAFVCHPNSGKVLYTGGNTRMISIARKANFSELLTKMSLLCNCSPSIIKIKFQFPGTSLDSPLVSIECDDDVTNMMDEFKNANKISLFLFTDQGHAPIMITGGSGPSTSLELANRDQPSAIIQGFSNSKNLYNAIARGAQTFIEGENGPNIALVKKDQTLKVGIEYADAKSFRNALRGYALANNFEILLVKSERRRVTAKCYQDGCTWRIHASKLPNVSTLRIRSFRSEHSCGGLNRPLAANTDWIVNCIEARVRDNIYYRPIEIVKDIQREYGVTLNYHTAYRGKQRTLERIFGSQEGTMDDPHTPQSPEQPRNNPINKVKRTPRPSPMHCGQCKQIGHNKRTCKKTA